jgi:hypothetical protein
MNHRSVAIALAAGLAVAPGALGQGPEIIYSAVATAPAAKRDVPGFPGLTFDAFFLMFGSPSGQYWTVRASTNDATTTDDVILFGSGTTAVVVAMEGTPSAVDPARTWGLFDSEIGINDSGTIAFQNNLSDPTTDDEVMVKYVLNAGVPTFDSVAFREGQPAPDAGVTSFIPAGALVGANISDAFVLADGSVCALVQLAALTGQITTSDDECVYKGGVAQQRELITSPIAWPNLWDFFSAAKYNATGSSSIVDGDDNSLTDDITAVNNTVVIQQGQVISGLTTAADAGASDYIAMTPSGDWMSMGNNTNVDEDWVVRNGVVVANALGGPTNSITPSTAGTELWSDTDYADCFVFVAGNAVGDYVICGVTNAPSNANAVVALNGSTVVSREGDPVDLDGNGQFDDNVYIRTYGDDTAFLTDDGWLYMRITLTSDQSLGNLGPNLGESLVRQRVLSGPAACYANCDESTTAPVLNVADFTCFLQRFAGGESYANCDNSTTEPVLNVADFTCFLQRFAAGCP